MCTTSDLPNTYIKFQVSIYVLCFRVRSLTHKPKHIVIYLFIWYLIEVVVDDEPSESWLEQVDDNGLHYVVLSIFFATSSSGKLSACPDWNVVLPVASGDNHSKYAIWKNITSVSNIKFNFYPHVCNITEFVMIKG
jgi:hypothetical protein